MNQISRRHFLQFVSSILSTVGLSQVSFLTQADRHGKVLAQGSPGRKLALLVGINDYSEGIPDLKGCLTDVELQWELLVHRYGFSPKDILVVADHKLPMIDYEPPKPTRHNILETFEKHLIAQARPGDVVVFHFSGHGSRVRDPHCVFPDCLVSVIVASDGERITGNTLWLLLAALRTNNVTFVLDSVYSGGLLSGSTKSRYVGVGFGFREYDSMSLQELEYQAKWLALLNLSSSEFAKLQRSGIAKGAVLSAAQFDQFAAAASFDGFLAGVFTYVLTQCLWRQDRNQLLADVFPSIAQATQSIAAYSGVHQIPVYFGDPDAKSEQKPIYFVNPQGPSSDGVISRVGGSNLKFWLGGTNLINLENSNNISIFSIVGEDGRERGEALLDSLDSRLRLIGKGRLIEAPTAPQPGLFLQERVRTLSVRELKLRVKLDKSLGNTIGEVVKALRLISYVSIVGEEENKIVDCIIGRTTNDYFQQFQRQPREESEPTDSLGLFSIKNPGSPQKPIIDFGGKSENPLIGLPIPGSFGSSNEILPDAVKRLKPRFRAMLASRIIRLALNSDSTQLNVTVTIMGKNRNTTIKKENSLNQDKVKNSTSTEEQAEVISSRSKRFSVGESIEFSVRNKEKVNLYLMILLIRSTSEITILFPASSAASEASSLITPGQTLRFTSSELGNFNLLTQLPRGITEILTIASTRPLRKAMQNLQQIGIGKNSLDQSTNAVIDPVDMVATFFDDFDEISRSSTTSDKAVEFIAQPEKRVVDSRQLSISSLILEIV